MEMELERGALGLPPTPTMNTLELKIPPLAVALCLAMLMGFTSWLVPPLDLPFGLRVGLALAFACAGLVISFAGVASFRRARTTVNPVKANTASSLVSGGVYRFTRNPMYLGFLLTLLAWAVWMSNPLAVLGAPLFVLYINRFQIVPEERVLLSLFGAEYAAYQSSVRRWL